MFGPAQAYATPVVEDVANKVTEGDAQVIVPPVAVAPGWAMLCDTFAKAEETQPLAGFVTTKL